MNQFIRIKSWYHLLQKQAVVDFIKTLDESVKLPSGVFFDGFLETMQSHPEADEIVRQLATRFHVSPDYIQQFLDKLFELGLLEYFVPDIPPPFNRYHRQLLLFDTIQPQINFENNYAHQEKLGQTHVLILGIGGIGNFIATALVAAGIGKITLVDNDVVEESNLNRQILFDEQSIGKNKVDIAAGRLRDLNGNCRVFTENYMADTREKLEKMIVKSGKVDYLVLSADKPVDIVLWASALCPKLGFKYIKCGYMAYQGLIGPLLGPESKSYETLFQSWADDIHSQSPIIHQQNEQHIAPSMAASNAILANITALEMIKDITGITPSVLTERRLLFNLKTMEMQFG